MIFLSSRKAISATLLTVMLFSILPTSFVSANSQLPEAGLVSTSDLNAAVTGSTDPLWEATGTTSSSPLISETVSDSIVSTIIVATNSGVVSSGTTNTGIISTGSTDSGATSTGNTYTGIRAGSGASGSIVVAPPIDYSTYSYYSGTWMQDGTTYGNSYYPNSLGLDPHTKSVQVYTYDQYTNLQKTKPKQKQGMKQSQSMMMSAMSVPTNWLLAEYLFDGNANDSSANAYNGTPTFISWPSIYTGSIQKSAMISVTGSIVTNNAALGAGATTMSWSMWIKPPTLKSEYTTVFNKWEGGANPTTFFLSCTNQDYGSNQKKYLFFVQDGSPHAYFSNALYTADSGIWTHIVFTYNAGVVSMYRNGVLDHTENIWGTSLPASSRPLDIGWGGNLWTTGLQGGLHSFRIYDHVLSASEIQDLYVAGNYSAPPPPSNNTSTAYTGGYLNSNLIAAFSPFENFSKVSNPTIKQQNADAGVTKSIIDAAWDPVNLATGEFAYENTLMNVPGVGLPYQLKIQYKNQATYNGPLGFNWDHNYNQYLSGETNGNVLYYNGQLGTFRFIKSGGVWLRNEWPRATLALSGSTYRINYDNGNVANFNTGSRLSNLTDINGNALNFTYSGLYLSGVTDTLGHTMAYSYFDHNRLKTVTDFSGRKADFIYYTGSTASGNLYDLANIVLTNSGVTKTIGFEYSTGITDPLSHNITRLIDAKGQVYVENTYTAEDRVATQRYGTASLGYTYTLSGSAITQNTVLDKLGNRSDYTYDANGNNTAIRYYNPAQTGSVLYSYTYNTLGLMTKEKRPRGNGYTYTYDTNGNLTQKRFKTNADAVDSASDLVTNLTYNVRNEKMTEINPNNTSAIYTRDTKGNILTKSLSGAVDYLGNTIAPMMTTYTYLPSGQLQTMKNPVGRNTQYYYTAGQITTLVRWTGGIMSTGSFTNSPYGAVLSTTDGDGFIKNYGYTVFDLVSTGTTAEWLVTSYSYDANNNKTRETRYLTWATANSYFYYDSLDHLTSSVIDINAWQSVTTTYTYDANGNVTDKKIWSTGATVHYTYNEFSKPTEERVLLVPGDTSKDIVTLYTYDTNNNLATKIDPRGYTTTYTYDLFDRVSRVMNPQNTTVDSTYNRDNTVDTLIVSSSTGLILSRLKTLYDNYGHTIKSVSYLDPVNALTPISKIYTYTNDFQVYQSKDEIGGTTQYNYPNEINGNRKFTFYPLGNVISETYNKRELKFIDYVNPASGTGITATSTTFDRDGRTIRTNDLPWKIRSYAYDNLGYLIKATDEMNRVTDIERDYRWLMTKSTNYSGAIAYSTIYTYDDRGNMTSILDPMNHLTSYQYDTINRNTKIVYPDMKEQNFVYDKSSNLLSRSDPNGTTVTNTYDSLNHLTARTISTGSGVGGVTSEIYSYDALGRLTSGGDNTNSGSYTGWATNTLTFSYDALSRLTSELEKPVAGTGYTVGYNYYITSDLASIVNPDSKTIGYTYDAIHRPLVISYSGQTISTNTYTGLVLDKATFQNGKTTNYTYDGLARIATINAWAGIAVPTYTYNDASDALSDGTKTYTYDGLIRLIGATPTSTGASTESYIYDKAGNRTVGTIGGNATNYTTNILDQYTLLTGSVNSGALAYDNNGNLTSDGQRTYKYDYNNRLIQVSTWTGVIAQYQYDILGRRTKKIDSSKSSTNPESTIYVYSWENILSEYKTIWVLVGGTGSLVPLTLKKNYFNNIGTDAVVAYDVDEQISPTSTGITTSRYYYHTNQLGSVIALSSSTGAVVQIYSYDSFGKAYVVAASGTGTTVTAIKSYTGNTYSNSRLYTGREYDKETNLYYLRARYYNSDTGKFVSRDPVAQADQVNLYTYVMNSPLMRTDRNWKKASQLVATVTIYSWREDGWVTQWHSWIEIQKNWTTHSYWLWPSRKNIWYANSNINSIDWVNVDIEIKVKAIGWYSSNISSVSTWLNSKQELALNTYINNSINDWVKWHTLMPCSDWATGAWNSTEQSQLSARDAFLISNPNTLADSINTLKEVARNPAVSWNGAIAEQNRIGNYIY